MKNMFFPKKRISLFSTFWKNRKIDISFIIK